MYVIYLIYWRILSIHTWQWYKGFKNKHGACTEWPTQGIPLTRVASRPSTIKHNKTENKKRGKYNTKPHKLQFAYQCLWSWAVMYLYCVISTASL